MPRYYLHKRQGSSYIPDEEGAEFDSLDDAYEEAVLAARELISYMAMTGIIDLTPLFEIVGEDGSRRLAPFWTRLPFALRTRIATSPTVHGLEAYALVELIGIRSRPIAGHRLHLRRSPCRLSRRPRLRFRTSIQDRCSHGARESEPSADAPK